MNEIASRFGFKPTLRGKHKSKRFIRLIFESDLYAEFYQLLFDGTQPNKQLNNSGELNNDESKQRSKSIQTPSEPSKSVQFESQSDGERLRNDFRVSETERIDIPEQNDQETFESWKQRYGTNVTGRTVQNLESIGTESEKISLTEEDRDVYRSVTITSIDNGTSREYDEIERIVRERQARRNEQIKRNEEEIKRNEQEIERSRERAAQYAELAKGFGELRETCERNTRNLKESYAKITGSKRNRKRRSLKS